MYTLHTQNELSLPIAANFSPTIILACYELTVEFNCNSMSKVIVFIVSIKFEELTRKKYWF